MGSRPWRRSGVPPMPALIPIAALRNGGKTPGPRGAPSCGGGVAAVGPHTSPAPDNNNGEVECEPCERESAVPLVDSGAEEASEPDSECEDEVRCSASSGADEGDLSGAERERDLLLDTRAAGEVEQEQEVRGCAGSARHERSRRQHQQPTGTAVGARRSRHAIDETPSRDTTYGEQAPTRRPRPERHRKSDRRRREHRSDRLLRKRSTSGSSNNTTTTTITTANSADNCQPAPPRVNPIFVWIRQEDTRIVDVRCEDYDKRNRILLTKTAHGWRAIPRTETLATTLEETPVSTPRHHHEHRHERSKNGPGRPRRKKNRMKGSRRESQPTEESLSPSPEIETPSAPVEAPPSPERPPSQSPAWSRMTADIETHLPSHTITVPKRKRTSTSSSAEVPSEAAEVRGVEDNQDIETVAVDSVSVNSVVAQAPLCRATNDASPLDKLLAVAELEFNHQVRAESSPQHSLTSIHSPQHELQPFEGTPEPDLDHQHEQMLQSPEPEELDDNALEHDESQINDAMLASEVMDCDYIDGGKDEHSLTDNAASGQTQDCDYNEEDDEDENHFSDVLDRLEQSLQSPNEIESEEILEEEIEDEEDACLTTQEESVLPEEEDVDETNYVPEQEAEQEPEEQIPEVPMEMDKNEDEHHEIEEEVEEEEEEEEEEEQFYDSLTEKSQDMDAQKDACELPTDLTLKSKTVEDDLMPTDLSKRKDEPEACEPTAVTDDMMPTDLSIRKHSSPVLTIEPIVRPPSQNSETIQSPQPSGIPAVPPSPDIYPITKQTNTKSVFLESLLSASPKLSLNPELTITRNQKEPLDLGKGRKSASPTVTCSEEAKHIGEPAPKRIKMEDITLKNLLHAEDKKPDISIKPVIVEKKAPANIESSRLLELLTADDSVPDAMTQFRQLLADPHINIPDPMLIPKDQLSQIIMAPAIEIPRLLVGRPELRIPDIFMYPKLMRDNDILVISMEQLKNIIEKNVPIPLAELEITKALKKLESPKPPIIEKQEKPEPKPVIKQSKNRETVKEHVNQQTISNDYQRYAQNLQHQQQMMLQEAQMKHHQNLIRKGGLASDIDAATTAAFNQMMWLPYLNQLEAAALATGNQQDFMKMLNTVFPSGGYPPPFPDHVPPMYNAGRFAMPNAFPMQPPIDYNPNALELAMWQEAMLRQKMPVQENIKYKETIDKRNYQMMMNKNKVNQNNQHIEQVLNNQKKNGYNSAEQQYLNSVQQQLLNGQLHPNNLHLLNGHYQNGHHQNGHYNSHMQQEKYKETIRNQQYKSEQQKIQMGPPLSNTIRTNLQIPHYNSSLSQAAIQKPVVPKSKEETLNKLFKYGNPFLSPKQKQDIQEQKQELRIPPRISRTQNIQIRNPGEPHKPIDLSDTKKKLKEASILDAHFRKYATREDAEVGSTTEEMSGHEAQTHHVWNPLFGK